MHPVDGLKKYIECEIQACESRARLVQNPTQAVAIKAEAKRLQSYLAAVEKLERGVEAQTMKPCPFCGSDNVKYEFSSSQGYITCNSCLADGPLVEEAADPICDIDAAIIAWNRRK